MGCWQPGEHLGGLVEVGLKVGLGCLIVAAWEDKNPFTVIAKLPKAHRWFDRAAAVVPAPGCSIETVFGQQLPAMLGD